jgi:hypothetical protein
MLHGFSLLTVIAVAGLVLDRRSAFPRIPNFLLLVVFIAFALALLSGNMGRMMFAAYVPVVAYALIAIEHFCSPMTAAVVGDDRCFYSELSDPYPLSGSGAKHPAQTSVGAISLTERQS